MIKVNSIYCEDILKGFEITGHANFDEYGSDIVCAAVSILAYTTVNSLDRYAYDIEFTDNDETMRLIVINPSEESEVILNTFNTGIWTLTQSYGDFVKAYTTTL